MYKDEYDVLETVIFTIRDPYTEPEAELSWSQGSFTGYTMIDFNQWKPTLSNPHGASIHYGCVEGGISINPITGMIGLTQDNSHIVTKTGTYHIYAVHDLDANFKYDSVVYTLNVEQGVNVTLQKNIDEGGSAVFLDRTDVSTLTHTYLSNPIYAKVAHGYTVRVKAEPATGYHFSGWYAGNNAAGYTLVSTNATFTYTVPNTVDIGLKAVFDTNTYSLNVAANDGEKGSVGGSNSAAKHFLNYGISATPNNGYHFVKWNDGSTDNPRTVTLTSNSTFTAIFAPDTFTITYMDGNTELNVDTFYYRQPITEYTTSKEGRDFIGWNPDVPSLMPAENLIVNALWNLICDSLQDVDGNKYPSVEIGNRCWMAANLRATHYADGRSIANIYEYQNDAYPNVAENVGIYGRLYDWYDAVDTATLTVSTRIQGICPDGWFLPAAEDVTVLSAIPATELRSTTGWLLCTDNTNSTGFTAYPAGMYNASMARYEGMGTETSWWSTIDPDPSTGITPSVVITAKSFCTAYYCITILTKSYLPTDAISVRCVKAGE